MIEDKFVGLALAMVSTMAIGTSFVITKKGLLEASERHGFAGDGFAYLKSPTWWGGIITLVIGEIANFAAYAFAPAILVTPLGALSVLIGAVLGSYFLKEELGTLGKLGCAMCLIGSVIIVLHAPPDKEVTRIEDILQYAIKLRTIYSCIFKTKYRKLTSSASFPVLLRLSSCFLKRHDLPGRSKAWKEESSHLPINLFDRWLCISHVGQSLRNRLEINTQWQQSIHPRLYLRLCHRHNRLYTNPNELFQQSPQPILNLNVSLPLPRPLPLSTIYSPKNS